MERRDFLSDIKKFWDTREVLPALGVACAWFAVLALAFSTLPLWLTTLAFLVVGLGTFIGLRNAVRLVYLERENTFHTSRLKRVIENMHEGVIVYSPQFKILDMNHAAMEMFRVPAQTVGMTVTPQYVGDKTFGLLTKIIYPSLAVHARQLSLEGWPQIVQIELQDPVREFVTVTDRVTDQGGSPVGFIKIVQDKTKERETSASKTEFVSTTAHELRTPLTGIKWVFESLVNTTTDADAVRLVTQGLELAERGLKLVNSMLEVAQIEEGEVSYRREPFDITLTVQSIVNEAQPIADKYGIPISFSKPNPLTVVGDEERIRSALEAVVENAIKYNVKDGSVTVELAAGAGGVDVIVRDTGIGISEDELRNLFSKFARGEKAKQIDPNGNGLGLYFARSVIQAHGGDIAVDSIVGRGSAFRISLPLQTSGGSPTITETRNS